MVVVDWRGTAARLAVQPAPGHHVAPDAPLRLDLRVGGQPASLGTVGAAAEALVVPIPVTRPVALEGTLAVSVCDDAGTVCVPLERTLRGTLVGARGRGLVLEAPEPPPPAGPARVAAEALDDLLDRTGDGLVLLDFGAAWCPSCARLDSELLEDPDDAPLLDGITVVEVDVDDHASWTPVSRYGVGVVPTLVAVDGTGAQVARLVGYPGEADARAWLAALPRVTPLSRPPDPASLSPEDAAGWALRLVQGQQESAAGPYLRRAAAAAAPLRDARLATFLMHPSPMLALELADRGVPVGVWGHAVLDRVDRVPELRARIQADARAALPGAPPAEAAELLGLLAAVAPPEAAPDLHRAAATTLAAGLSGDRSRDRGHLGPLARSWEAAGDIDAAIAVLQRGLDDWPDEPTFHQARAALALRAGDLPTAVAEAEAAVRLGYGDNKLRSGVLLARALHASGRSAEAVQLIDRLLAETRLPDPAAAVRTHRHLDALRALRREVTE